MERAFDLKKIRPLLAALALLALLALCAAAAAAPRDTLFVEGRLEGLEEAEDGRWILYVWADGQKASAPLASDCRFYVDQKEVSREEFAERGVGEFLEVDLHGGNGEVFSCRVSIIRAN